MGGWDARLLRENSWTLEPHLDKAVLQNGPRLRRGAVHFIPKDALRGFVVGRRGRGDGRGGFQYGESVIDLVALGRAFGPAYHLHDERGVGALEPQLRPLGGGGLVDALRTT